MVELAYWCCAFSHISCALVGRGVVAAPGQLAVKNILNLEAPVQPFAVFCPGLVLKIGSIVFDHFDL